MVISPEQWQPALHNVMFVAKFFVILLLFNWNAVEEKVSPYKGLLLVIYLVTFKDLLIVNCASFYVVWACLFGIFLGETMEPRVGTQSARLWNYDMKGVDQTSAHRTHSAMLHDGYCDLSELSFVSRGLPWELQWVISDIFIRWVNGQILRRKDIFV